MESSTHKVIIYVLIVITILMTGLTLLLSIYDFSGEMSKDKLFMIYGAIGLPASIGSLMMFNTL
jgi:hypothetical protein